MMRRQKEQRENRITSDKNKEIKRHIYTTKIRRYYIYKGKRTPHHINHGRERINQTKKDHKVKRNRQNNRIGRRMLKERKEKKGKEKKKKEKRKKKKIRKNEA